MKHYFEILFAFLWGISWGSFGGNLIYRAIHGLSIFYPHFSFCPNCKIRLKWSHNIPIFSFILLKGKCANCKSKIEITHIISEFLSGILSILCIYVSDSLIEFISVFFFVWGLLIASISDIKYLLIPTLSIMISTFGAIMYTLSYGEIKSSIIGALFGAGILLFTKLAYKIIRKKEGLGEGDIMFMIPIGIYFGFFKTVLTLIFSSFIGGFLGLMFILIGGKKMSEKEIPFVPFLFLAVSTIIIMDRFFPNFSFLFLTDI